MNAKLILFLSCFAAVTLTASAVNAAPRGGGGHGGHGGHFSSMSPRGGHTFSRGGSTFSRGTSGTYRNWGGRNWSGGNWSGGNWSDCNWSGNWRHHHHHHHNNNDVIFIGSFGFPYWGWGWGYPYGYYGFGYPYGYGYYGSDGYGYGYGDRSSVAQLQRRLARAGYYYGAIDGIMGPRTRRALCAYQRDHAYGMINRRLPAIVSLS